MPYRAIKDTKPVDDLCLFTGKTAIYYGSEDNFDNGKGHKLLQNQTVAVCFKIGAP